MKNNDHRTIPGAVYELMWDLLESRGHYVDDNKNIWPDCMVIAINHLTQKGLAQVFRSHVLVALAAVMAEVNHGELQQAIDVDVREVDIKNVEDDFYFKRSVNVTCRWLYQVTKKKWWQWWKNNIPILSEEEWRPVLSQLFHEHFPNYCMKPRKTA